ncbi:hypothetical protein [Shewanella sedimentimangrovi]|uniref:Uncharacterized protein n=1 Tax=Shewanella sedimentimangrovi TaxID=2814293 RepID=A0ABX7R5P3_9GAMM|nr:hypothetical protein [Shewanella sedimentimangrovi]QSX38400.1 hypothetical protein JYB85_06150 [Shewanella sedimentimangrovi]
MAANTMADLILHFMVLCISVGFIFHGYRLRQVRAVTVNFASPTVFIIIGILLAISQIFELADIFYPKA